MNRITTGVRRGGRPVLRAGNKAGSGPLSGFFAALFFLAFLFLVGGFEFGFELLALFGLDLVALLLLGFELLFGAEKFDKRLLAAVSLAEAGANDAQVATLAVAVTRRHGFKQPRNSRIGLQEAERLAARVKIALLAESDHLFDVRANCLGLGHGSFHAVFHEDGRDQVAQQGATVAGVASELESCIAMAHDVKLSFGLQWSVISDQWSVK